MHRGPRRIIWLTSQDGDDPSNRVRNRNRHSDNGLSIEVLAFYRKLNSLAVPWNQLEWNLCILPYQFFQFVNLLSRRTFVGNERGRCSWQRFGV